MGRAVGEGTCARSVRAFMKVLVTGATGRLGSFVCKELLQRGHDVLAALVALVLERQQPGYHQYFPAQALTLEGYTVESTLTRFFPNTPLRRPETAIGELVDRSALERDFGFRPCPPLTVRLARP
jgi:NAD(P)-dependent dehydrogenase (short-subunit alcohol dehydrogenase family)